MADEYDLAILLVHGIGAQKRGDTLLSFGEPLGDSVRRWLEDEHAIELEGTYLLDTRGDDPAHASVTISHDGETKRLLVAESCWADTFPVPGWWPLAGWLGWCLPFVVFRATDHRLSLITTHNRIDACYDRDRTVANVAVWLVNQILRIVKNVLSVVLALVATAYVLLAGVIAIVPRLRAAVLSTQLLLVRYIGDSYALLMSPGRRDAMVSKVQRDLEWVAGKDRKVVVIAHSQGAEVVRQVLARRSGPPIASLVTLGSGIAKLCAVGQLHGQAGRGLAAYVLRVGAAGLAVVSALALAGLMPWWLVVGFPVSGLLIHLARGQLQRIVREEELIARVGALAGKTDRWLDLFATSDPVPEDALPFRQAGLTRAWSREIANRRSPLLDHTSYWQNVEAFHSAVMRELAGVLRVFDWQIPRSVVARAQRHRWRQTYWLVVARITVAVLVFGAIVLPRLGPGRGWWDDGADWLGDVGGAIAGVVDDGAKDWLGNGFGRHLLVGSVLLIVGAILYALAAGVWNRAAGERARRLFADEVAETAEAATSPAEPLPV